MEKKICRNPNGIIERTITTSDGTRTVAVARGRIVGKDRRDARIPQLAAAAPGRSMKRFSSGNCQRAPCRESSHVLKVLFTSWQNRNLSAERDPIIFLDGFHLKIRVARRVVSVPVPAALGAAESYQKCLIDLRVVASEAEAMWGGVITSLKQRGLAVPLLLIVDGNTGL